MTVDDDDKLINTVPRRDCQEHFKMLLAD
jgi:hypothetical protein